MLGALRAAPTCSARYGGHRQAAGLSLDRGRLADFRLRVTGLANARLEPEDLVPRLRVDAPLPLPSLIGEVVAGVEAMAPFGLAIHARSSRRATSKWSAARTSSRIAISACT